MQFPYLLLSNASLAEVKSFLIDNLTSPHNEVTRSLVGQSGFYQREGFIHILQSLLEAGIADADHPNIQLALRRTCEDWSPATQEWVSSPLFRSWLHRFIYQSDETDIIRKSQRFVDEITNYCLDLYHEKDTQITLVSCNGKIELYRPEYLIRCPVDGLIPVLINGDIIIVGSQDSPFLMIERSQGSAGIELSVCYEAQECSLVKAPRLPCSRGVVVRNDLNSLRVKLDITRSPERSSTYTAALVEIVDDYYPPYSTRYLESSCRWLVQAWPEEFGDWEITLQAVVPYKAHQDWMVTGFTISSMQGACWVAAGRPIQVLESLVHEQSHVKLRYLEEYIPILEPEQGTRVFSVGWRSDPRPLVGIYEGIYVNMHVMEAFRRILGSCPLSVDARNEVLMRGRELHQQVQEAAKILFGHGKFTEVGIAYKDWVERRLGELASLAA
ncbi:aKG-HExxH-type peptide beta-hydroxylase [Nitrosomonas sp.]|uniref:aKG-HExxH-type peptide beta-hydroxylase n=1 Tax=Nitrosomonas sp. TaxID=42353 RepID=UPI00330646C2